MHLHLAPSGDRCNERVGTCPRYLLTMLAALLMSFVVVLLPTDVLQETADERWRPILGVEQILISVISLFADPNDESPANIDAAVQWREDRDGFKKAVRKVVDRSMED